MPSSQIAPPIIIRATGRHSASMIFFHGLGDQGGGWASVFQSEMRVPYMKFVFPNAQSRPVSLNFGMKMPAWYDILGLNADALEDDVGIENAKNYVHDLIREEIATGIPSKRILLGGFSMGGALAIYAGLTFDKPLGCIVSISGFLLQRSRIPGNHTFNLQTPIFVGHGRNDSVVPFNIGQLTEQTLRAFNKNVVFKAYPCQHQSTSEEHKDILQFINKHIPPQ